jgi:hypothetical protein
MRAALESSRAHAMRRAVARRAHRMKVQPWNEGSAALQRAAVTMISTL